MYWLPSSFLLFSNFVDSYILEPKNRKKNRTFYCGREVVGITIWFDKLGWKVKVSQSCLTLCDPMDYTLHGILQARIVEWVAFPFSRASSQPRDWTQVSCIRQWILYHWATWEAQEYWVGSLSLLQGIFPTQESNRGLLHCRQSLYQLSYERSPYTMKSSSFLPVFPTFLLGELIDFVKP